MSHSYEGIVFDLDKTAVQGGSLEVDQATIDAMAAVQRRGGIAIAATGRAISFATPIIEQLDLEHGSIVGNGAVVHHRDRPSTWQKMIEGESLHQIYNLADEAEKTLFIPGPDRQNRLPETFVEGSEGAWIIDVEPELVDDIIGRLAEIEDFHVYPSPAWRTKDNFDINIGHAEAQKHLALAHLLEELNLNPDNLIGVGDGLNDISFMQMLGLRIAPTDAHIDVLKIADGLIDPQSEGGFVDALRMVAGK